MKKDVLVYLDILGFEKRAKKDAEKTSLKSNEVREAYRKRIESKLSKLKASKTKQEYPKKECSIVSFVQQVTLDSWLLFTDDAWNAFKSIGEVLKTGLPMEIVIGVKEFKESQSREELVTLKDETIAYLKSDILTSYRKIRDKKIGQTFVLLTKEVYDSIDSPNISHAKLYKSSKGEQFYLIEKDQLEKMLISLKFLEKLGSKRPEYREIDALYVEPKSYDQITNILKVHNAVFIVGDAGMGKTYTAIKLLFDYYREGYEPIYFREEERELQWKFIKEKQGLEGKAIFLEDPWDKVEFKSTGSLFKDVGSLVREVKRCNCKVILSSREKVFREFVKRKETVEDLWSYTCVLALGSAYTRKELTRILRNYIDVFKPPWSKNKSLRKIAFEFAEQNLNTPISIKEFVDNTIDTKNEKSLLVGGKKAAEETRISFAREIEEMFRRGLYDHLVFLSFPFVTAVDVEIARSSYWEVLKGMKKLGYDLIRAKDFDTLIEEFIRIVEIDTKSNWTRYIHPLYQQAFGSTLTCDGKPSDISKKIFSRVVTTLSEKNQVSRWISFSVSNYFDKLPEKIRNDLLVSLSKKGHVAGVAHTITIHFRNASEELRNLLLKISENDDAAEQMALLIAHNFDELPEDIRNKLLFEFTEKDQAAKMIAKGLRSNFDGLPAQVRNKLLLKLVKKDQIGSTLAVVALEYFNKIPEDIRNKLLLKLSFKNKAVEYVAMAVSDYFDLLPEELRNELLLRLSKEEKAAHYVALTITYHFNKLPQDIRNLLDRLQDPLRLVIESYAHHFPLRTIKIISNVRSKINPHFALEILDKLSRSENEKVKIAAKPLIDSIQTDLRRDKECRE